MWSYVFLPPNMKGLPTEFFREPKQVGWNVHEWKDSLPLFPTLSLRNNKSKTVKMVQQSSRLPPSLRTWFQSLGPTGWEPTPPSYSLTSTVTCTQRNPRIDEHVHTQAHNEKGTFTALSIFSWSIIHQKLRSYAFLWYRGWKNPLPSTVRLWKRPSQILVRTYSSSGTDTSKPRDSIIRARPAQQQALTGSAGHREWRRFQRRPPGSLPCPRE